MFTYLKGPKRVDFLIRQGFLCLVKVAEALSELFFVLNLGIVESTVQYDTDLMRRRRLGTSFEIRFQKLNALFVVEKPVFIELIHFLAELHQDVDLT